MVRRSVFLIAGLLLFISTAAYAEFPVISAQDVKSGMIGKRKALVIDTRLPEEYQESHIPGSINIPAERIRIEAARLPKDKTTPIIFYCRGAG